LLVANWLIVDKFVLLVKGTVSSDALRHMVGVEDIEEHLRNDRLR